MPIKFAVKIVRLKVYMTMASPMTLTIIQGHKCVSNLTTFKLARSRIIFKLLHRPWHDCRLMHGIHAQPRFDDLQLDLDFKNVCRACTSWVFFSADIARYGNSGHHPPVQQTTTGSKAMQCGVIQYEDRHGGLVAKASAS